MINVRIDQLIRSRRRTISLQITSDAKLIVRAPLHITEDYIQKIIDRKESWIKTKQEFFLKRRDKAFVRKFVPGEEFLYLGQAYALIKVDHLPKAVVFENSLMISSMVLANAQDHLESWYKAQALGYISQRVGYYAQQSGLKYTSIRINNATTRWGSCGYKDTLNFTWRLIMAPPRVVDYVIVHELMHLKQKNHSHRFWAEVANIIPDFKKDERWLKENGHLLAWPL